MGKFMRWLASLFGPSANSMKESSEPIEAKMRRYRNYVCLIIFFIPMTVGIFTATFMDSWSPLAFTFGVGLALVGAYIGLSYRFYDPIQGNQITFLTLFGEPVKELSDGIPFAPLFITKIIRYKRPIRQREFPAEPEKIWDGEMKDADEIRQIPAGFKPPIRITFRAFLEQDDVERIIGDDDLTVLDLQKMDVEIVGPILDEQRGLYFRQDDWESAKKFEAVQDEFKKLSKAGQIKEAREKKIKLPWNPRSDWGQFSYRELRHLEKLAAESNTLKSRSKESSDTESSEIRKRLEEIEYTYPGSFYIVNFASGDKLQAANSEEKDVVDALNRRVTATVVPVVRWMINDPIMFYLNIGSDDEVNRQIQDEMVSVFQRLLPKISVGQALENINWINAHLYLAVVKRTLKWGIQVEGAFQKQIRFNHDLNGAIAALPEAIYRGEAAREEETRRGIGKAAAARALETETLLGRADGMAGIAKALDIDGSLVQASEVARDIAEGGNAVVVGSGGMSELAGIAAAAAFKKNDTKGIQSDKREKED